MIFTTQMTQLFAVVLGRDRDRVTEALLREGVMQFISVSEIDLGRSESLMSVRPEVSLAELSDMRKRIEGVLYSVGLAPPQPKELDLENRVPVNLPRERARLDKIDGERESIRERQRSIQQEILKLEDIKRQVDLYGVDLGGLQPPGQKSMLAMRTGMLSAANLKALEDELKGLPALHMVLNRQDGVAHCLLLSMKRDREQIETILSGVGWTSVELPKEALAARKDLFQEVGEKLKSLTEEQQKLQGRVKDLVGKEEEKLKTLWVNLRINELCARIQSSFQSSSRTVVFAGWLASSKQERLSAKIMEATEGRCYLEWHKAGSPETAGSEIPIEFNNPKALAPFQMLVQNFGIPAYGTIDPTPFVMPIYLAMFGLMFADAGQGLILALLGGLGAWKLKADKARRGLYTLSSLIVWCGISAMVFGVLFGSYFGKPWLPPAWFDFHGIVTGHGGGNGVISNIYDILAITIYFGMAVIVLGLLFNWINLVRTRNWAELVFDKGGVLGGWMYGGGAYIAFYLVGHSYSAFPPGRTIFLLVGVPALLLFFKEPYHYFRHSHGEKKPNIFLNADDGVDGMGCRVAGNLQRLFVQHALVHASRRPGYRPRFSDGVVLHLGGNDLRHLCRLLILIVGNIMVIGLEGLSAGIQALRLNYYEFFTKFFHGTGHLYTPVSLTSES